MADAHSRQAWCQTGERIAESSAFKMQKQIQKHKNRSYSAVTESRTGRGSMQTEKDKIIPNEINDQDSSIAHQSGDSAHLHRVHAVATTRSDFQSLSASVAGCA
jgi:hypothetical protein